MRRAPDELARIDRLFDGALSLSLEDRQTPPEGGRSINLLSLGDDLGRRRHTRGNHDLANRRFREQQVLNALRAGQATVETIAESIYDGLAPALMPAARENVRAHLEKLRTDGAAAHEDDRWTAS